jgi:benzodiazapine receptor
MPVMRMQSLGALLIFLVICLSTGFLGGLLTRPAILSGWYDSLTKPFFTPPAWVFGPVWTLLYLLIAVAAWLVWAGRVRHPVRIPLMIFFAQLVLNILWSALFFGAQRPGWAMVEIIFLWIFILGTVILFWRVHRLAAMLLVPYTMWVSFAVVLNGALWWLNRGTPYAGGMILN